MDKTTTETTNDGGVVADTPEKIDFFRLAAFKGAVGLEVRGMRHSVYGRGVWKLAIERFNIPKEHAKNREAVHEWLKAEVARRLKEAKKA